MGLHSSARYLGAMPCKDLYTVTQILYNARHTHTHTHMRSGEGQGHIMSPRAQLVDVCFLTRFCN